MQKRGSAHFEMIVSFVFFIGFVFFVFTVLKPYDAHKLSYVAVDGVFDSLNDKASTNFTKLFLRLNSSDYRCLFVNLSSDLFRYEFNNSRVFDIDGKEIDSNFIGSELNIAENKTFFYVYFSPDFTEESISCSPNETNYTIGGFEQRRVISLKSLETMQKLYYENYKKLKEDLGVPPIYDFSISSDELGISMQGMVPEKVDVLAKEKVLEVLNYSSARILSSRINVRIW